MTFDVDVHRLALVPTMLDRLSHDARRCEAYAAAAFDFEFGPGVINAASGRHAEVRALITAYFRKIAERADEISRGVADSVRDYENNDLERAAEWDRLLPTVDRPAGSRMPALDLNLPQARVQERAEPESHLAALTDYRPALPYEPTWTDLCSPTNISRDVMMGVNWLAVQIGIADRVHDPLDFLAVPWFGNWAGMKACADAQANLVKACADMRTNCGWIEIRVCAVWQGKAADAAWMRLKELNDLLDRGAPVLSHTSAAYAAVVDEVARLEEVAEVVIGEMFDSAFCAIAAYLTAPSLVVPAVLTAARTIKIVDSMRRLGAAGDLVSGLQAAVAVFEGELPQPGTLDLSFELAGQLES